MHGLADQVVQRTTMMKWPAMRAALGYERIRMSLQPETPRVVRICGPTLSAHWLTSMNSNNMAIKSLVFRAARGLLFPHLKTMLPHL